MALRFSKAADQDLIDIYLYGEARFGERQAERHREELYEALRLLDENPELARLRLEYEPPVRVHAHRPHVIVDQTDSAGVLVLRVRHGREDWQAALI